jgi:hypothetical protein
MNRLLTVAILIIGTLPLYAQSQQPNAKSSISVMSKDRKKAGRARVHARVRAGLESVTEE